MLSTEFNVTSNSFCRYNYAKRYLLKLTQPLQFCTHVFRFKVPYVYCIINENHWYQYQIDEPHMTQNTCLNIYLVSLFSQYDIFYRRWPFSWTEFELRGIIETRQIHVKKQNICNFFTFMFDLGDLAIWQSKLEIEVTLLISEFHLLITTTKRFWFDQIRFSKLSKVFETLNKFFDETIEISLSDLKNRANRM